MRRIPRLRRPSGLPSPSTTTTTNISRSVAGPSHIAQPFSSSSQSTISALPSRQRPTAARSFVSPPSLARFSSSEKQPEQKTPTPTREPEVEAQTQAQTQEQEPGTGPGTELQHASRVADDIIDHRTGDSFSWSEETAAISAGPYTAPPSQRVEAARQHEVADPTYSPATTSEGLKTVGGLSGWWSNPDHWGAGGDFTSFRPREKVTDPALIEAAVRRAVVEAFALREVGHEDQLLSVWPTTVSKADLQGLLAWDLKSTGDGSPTLGGSAAVVAEGLRWKDDSDIVSGDHDAQHEEILSSAEAAALSQTWDQSWKTISLVDPRIRFAVTKRLFQLTGQLIPDHQLPGLRTVHSLLAALKKPPKPATLTEEIATRHPELLAMPNITVSPKRVTRGDKEKALGRYKLTQAEFRKRNLPTDGHGWERKGKEMQRHEGAL
ncbi:ribosomal subunit 39S-domain-containing protein [Nemania diffusa]|nr:ribosomal subunit 39S-domain-containing protein [Nemania diffusa]